MKKAYVVTSGDYSDYRIRAVFSNKKAAEAYVENVRYREYCEIEDWPLNATHEHKMPKWQVNMQRHGKAYCFAVDLDEETGNRFQAPTKGQAYMVSTVEAKDAEHATKIANEQRAQFIAAGYWYNPESHPNRKTLRPKIGGAW